MANEVGNPTVQPASAAAPGAATGPSVMDRVDGGLEGLWHLLTSMRVAMILMLAIAALAIPGTLLRQIPVVALNDPGSKADWINSVRPYYGGWTGVFDGLQLFNVFNSLPFRLLVGALTISLIACSVHRIPGMLRTVTKPRVDVGPAFFEHAPQHEAIVAHQSPAETRAAVETALRGRHYRTLATDDGVIHVYADQFRWLSFSGLIAHLAIVAILLGAIVSGTFGYRDPDFSITVGATREVATDSSASIKLVSFSDSFDPVSGAPIDYASEVILYKDGAQVGSQTIRVNDPLHFDGYTFYQSSYGPAATITIADTQGKQLAAEGIPLKWSVGSQNRPLGIYTIPGSDYTLWVIGTTGAAGDAVQPGQVELQLYSSGATTPVADQVVDQGKPATLAGMTMTFDRESQFTLLNVANDPGVPLVWGGALLLFAGFTIRFLFPHKRVWGRITPRPNGGATVGMATLSQKNVSTETEFDHIVNDIRTALQAPAQG